MKVTHSMFRSSLIASSLALALVAAPSLHAADTASAGDKVFVGKVSQGGMYEVEASKVAEMKAVAQDVKDQAVTEVHDHELVNAKLKRIATAAGVPVAAQLNPMFQQRLHKLKATPAADFDAAYIADMQQIHDGDEKLFAQEAMEGSADFKPFAHETDLIVKRHIGALQGTEK
jgi:putative membrane protein